MAEDQRLNSEEQDWLLALARRTLEGLAATGAAVPDEKLLIDAEVPEGAQRAGGVFVTLHKAGDLRGCIGYVESPDPLYQSVIANAVNAARRDPRFPPVKLSEVASLDIEISVMSPIRPIRDIEEIEVGRDGLIVSRGMARGLLLPQVATDHGWDRDTFLDHTCRKAGLPMDAWRKDKIKVKIEAFSAQVFSEK